MFSLILVAQRVLQWIEPLLYRTLFFDYKSGPIIRNSALRLQDPTRWTSRKPVQHLLVWRCADFVQRILPLCDGIRNLAFHQLRFAPSMLPVVGKMQLQKLNVDLLRLFTHPMHFDPTLPMFRGLTHLRVQNATKGFSFTALPALTHLCVEVEITEDTLLSSTLANCNKLHVLLGIFWEPLTLQHWDRSFGDLRLVLMYARSKLPFEAITDWLTGTRGGSDFWVRAEKFVAKRRRGEIQPASRDWIEDSDLIE
ncbi:hypothetical protein C8J57DRAFT_1515400 [Mycena rebaudengoi]|nr:hypothetical protein C8J57DRAFT_1515400 [Mycena rebaudengoi]